MPEYGLEILIVAVVTFITRISGFSIGDRPLPEWATRALDAVPIAAFAALIVPGVATGEGEEWIRIPAAILAGAIFALNGKLWLGLLAGMGVYWSLLLLA